ncbi:type I secretion system permease/ATPase [Jannaschia ovalis]|uniref:Type I secretion system permease/ATPase n=1 Tax=Jannaschia ovalis TaxID=3038773 RepID=A0ABY8LEB6_9RHOB|nr:type I secretion system permease/ATPase [Jannaschia sp. GRR-S6-38]WGH79661.1 type I secretion system permease/ATPase [Jannaschia sp. GRR-S6-38]
MPPRPAFGPDDPVARALAPSRGLLAMAFLFSVFVNLLMLTGPLYMLQVYDRVLGSRSEETLVALSILATFLFVTMGVLDHARGRVMARVGARLQAALDGTVFDATLRAEAARPGPPPPASPMTHIDAIRRLLASPVFLALFDLPWTPLFLAAIFLFHPALGWLAMAGGAALVALALANRAATAGPALRAQAAEAEAEAIARQVAAQAEVTRALGMAPAARHRWADPRGAALVQAVTQSDRAGGFTTATKTARLFLQSAMLGLGAWLVLQGALTAGAMIAGSILLGRALAPIETLVGQWQLVGAARRGQRAIRDMLRALPPPAPRLSLPVPRGHLSVADLTLIPPGGGPPVLRGLSFALRPGQALGVIGASGAGKTSLARALCGIWPPAAGQVRLDGATLDQYAPEDLGAHIGYLPQVVTLIDGTIAQNIARLRSDADPAAIHAAARRAAAHDMITALPEGYDTRIGAEGGGLSGGQIQRIGLARALFGAPRILVLDEPNSNLDHAGGQALNHAIREMKAAGCTVIVIAHRPAAIRDCDLLLRLERGVKLAFGPRDDVLRQTVRNHALLTAVAEEGP